MTLDDVRELALSLPRSYEAVVRGRVKFRVGQIVYVAFSHDGETMGFGFPKELRDALVQSEPHKFSLPSQSDSSTAAETTTLRSGSVVLTGEAYTT
jgi:hypothetical protein